MTAGRGQELRREVAIRDAADQVVTPDPERITRLLGSRPGFDTAR